MNDETKYKVTKIKVKDDTKYRMVNSGDTVTGEVFATVGKRMQVWGRFAFDPELLTSPVEEIKDLGNGNFLVDTVNSVYSLEKL